MKKLLICTNLITLALVLFFGCSKTENKQLKKSFVGGCTITPDVDPTEFEISTDLATRMLVNYTNDHWKTLFQASLASGNMYVDSRSVWFSLAKLQGYINYIQEQASLTPLAGMCCDSLGIRIYFGEYDRDLAKTFGLGTFSSSGTYNNYMNKTTVLMVPTFRWADGTNHDFNPKYDPTNLLKCNQPDSSGWPAGGTMVGLMMNHGGICPPPWPVLPGMSMNCSGDAYLSSGADFMLQNVDQAPSIIPLIQSLPASGSAMGGCND